METGQHAVKNSASGFQVPKEYDHSAETLALLVDAAEKVSGFAASLARIGVQKDDEVVDDRSVLAFFKLTILQRRLREKHIDPELLADPAWDMLVDLTVARMEGKNVAISSLCIAAGVPTTTALRWIRNLVDIGHFVRIEDTKDARRTFIRLSDSAFEAMHAYGVAAETERVKAMSRKAG